MRNSASTAGRHPPRIGGRQLLADEPRELPEDLEGDAARLERQRRVCRSASAVSPVLDRVGDGPVVLRRFPADDLLHVRELDLRLPGRVEQQAIDVAAQRRDVGAGALGDQPRGGAGRSAARRPATACLTSASAMRATCRRSTLASLPPLQAPALDDRRLLAAAPCRAAATDRRRPRRGRASSSAPGCRTYASRTSRSLGGSASSSASSLVERLSAPLRLEDPLGAKHDDHAAVAHHRQRPRRLDDRGRRRPFLAGVDAARG